MSEEIVFIYRPGSLVKFLAADYTARVLAVCIRDQVTYEVAWWAGSERRTAWVSEHEIRTFDGALRQQIGFLAGQSDER